MAQIPVLQASAAKLTAVEISGIAVAAVLVLCLVSGISRGVRSRKQETAASGAKPSEPPATGIIALKPVSDSPKAADTKASPSSLRPDMAKEATGEKPINFISSGLTKVDGGFITLLALAGAAIDGVKPVSRGTSSSARAGEGDVRWTISREADKIASDNAQSEEPIASQVSQVGIVFN